MRLNGSDFIFQKSTGSETSVQVRFLRHCKTPRKRLLGSKKSGGRANHEQYIHHNINVHLCSTQLALMGPYVACCRAFNESRA
eukprot:scaffold106817_cov42-Prasinocladus_malaysianus.AAC.2